MDPRSGDTTFGERRVRHRGLRGANNEVSVGDGRAMAWRVSARVRRWREAPCRDRSKNEEPKASVSSHNWRWRKAPRHGPVTLWTKRHKKGADLRRVMAGADPEWCRYAAARRTGMPILRALSIILFVMPEPGKATRPFGRKFNSTSLRRKGAALPSLSQFGLQTT